MKQIIKEVLSCKLLQDKVKSVLAALAAAVLERMLVLLHGGWGGEPNRQQSGQAGTVMYQADGLENSLENGSENASKTDSGVVVSVENPEALDADMLQQALEQFAKSAVEKQEREFELHIMNGGEAVDVFSHGAQ